jgi:G3E family GTPase
MGRAGVNMTRIDIISGFLGAGKTTLIKKLLKEALGNTKVVLIENEFGEIGIDGGFLQESGIEIKEMNSGCICCSLVGDFGSSLREVVSTYKPERILIEPSGVGKLSDVQIAVENVAKDMDVEVNSAITVVDAMKCKMYSKNFGEFFLNQVAYAGAIFLSRTDHVSMDKLETTLEILRSYNDKAVIVTTPWDQLDGQVILDTMEGTGRIEDMLQDMLREEATQHSHHEHDENCTCGCHDHDHHNHDHHGHDHEDHEHDDHVHHDHEHHDHDHDHDYHDHKHHDHDHDHDYHDHKHHDHDHDYDRDDHKHHDHDHDHDRDDHKHHDHDHDNDRNDHEHHDHDHDHDRDDHEHHDYHHDRHDHDHDHDDHDDSDHDNRDQDHHHHHHADEIFTSWGLETPKYFTDEQIRRMLDQLDTGVYGNILRAKGMVSSEGEGWLYFDYVPEEHDLRKGNPQVTGKICVIGENLKEDKLAELFQQ